MPLDPILTEAWEQAFACRPEPADLSVRQTLFLLAACAGLNPGGEVLHPLRELGQRVAPTPTYTSEIFHALDDWRLIAIDPAAVEPGTVDDLVILRALNRERLSWRLALGRDARECQTYLRQLRAIAPARWGIQAHGHDLADVWLETVHEECIAHLEEYVTYFGLPTEVVLDLRDSLRGLLAHLSGGQVIAAIWSAVKTAAAERQAGRGVGDPAAAIDGRLHWLFDAFVEGRMVPFSYTRSRRQRACALADLLTNRFGLGGAYLDEVPSPPALAAALRSGPWPEARTVGE